MQFIFGEGTQTPTAEALARRRALARQLAEQSMSSAPQNIGEGLTAIGQALAGRMMNRRADRDEMRMGRNEFLQDAKEARAQSPNMQPRAAIIQALTGGAGVEAVIGGGGADMLLPQDPATLPPQMTLGPHTMGAQDMLGREGGYGGPVGSQYPDEPMQQMAPSPGVLPPSPSVPPPLPGVPVSPSRVGSQGPQGASKDERTRMQDLRDREALTGLDLNTSESRSTGWAARMMQAEETLRRLEQQGTRGFQRALEWLPGETIENYLFDDEFRQYRQAEDAFLNSALRSDTGAQINESEIPRLRAELMPRAGDDDETLAQKRRSREAFLLSIIASSGPAATMLPRIGDPVVPRSNSAPPAGIDPADWQYMTPEERALFQ